MAGNWKSEGENYFGAILEFSLRYTWNTAKKNKGNRKDFTFTHHSPVLTPISSLHYASNNLPYTTNSISILVTFIYLIHLVVYFAIRSQDIVKYRPSLVHALRAVYLS